MAGPGQAGPRPAATRGVGTGGGSGIGSGPGTGRGTGLGVCGSPFVRVSVMVGMVGTCFAWTSAPRCACPLPRRRIPAGVMFPGPDVPRWSWRKWIVWLLVAV